MTTSTLEKKPDRASPQKRETRAVPTERISVMALLMSLAVGVWFGIVLTKSEVVRWQRIHAMFRFEEPNMYLIIGVGVVVAMVSMLILKAVHAKSIEGDPIVYPPKPFHQGVVYGGMVFGAGWAITGACPGPIYAQIGAGAGMAWFTLTGALVGTYLYALWKPRLPH